MSKKNKGSVWSVEVRWENTRESVADARYIAIEEVVGSREDAEQHAQEYLDRRASRACASLEWIDGLNGRHPCRYAFNSAAAFRVTQV